MSLVALRRKGGEAIYSQIAKLLKEEIASFCSPGECLPSENELAERFGVNRHTIRRAIDDLIASGLVERRHGKGTFVLDGPADYVLGSSTRFTETFESLGQTASSRILRKLTIPARGGVARRLQLVENEPVVWIESLRMADDRPICVISHFLPQRVFPDILAEYQGGSLRCTSISPVVTKSNCGESKAWSVRRSRKETMPRCWVCPRTSPCCGSKVSMYPSGMVSRSNTP
ncbi:MAG: GntR family transcriptional regulator [Hydrogenophilus sp.]